MNLNYVGSVAERFMKFRTSLARTEGVADNIFNAISIYVPKSLAENNLSAKSYDASAVTAEKYAVIAVTVDNYKDVLSDGGALLTQWLPIFNDGANMAVTLYIIVFDDTSFNPTLTAGAITWQPLSKAFNELYFISFFKTMFSEHYNGKVISEGAGAYDDSNYFDLALCLAYLCETELTLSFGWFTPILEVPEEGASDTNECKVMTISRGAETAHCLTFVGTDKADRAQYFWGYWNMMGASRSVVFIHNGNMLLPTVLGTWFLAKNASGQFVGNKLAKIRLTGNKVKPTGLPSPLNSDVNLNLVPAIYNILDEKHVGYFISIADNSQSDSELISDRSGNDYPATAYAIAKWIDYNTSQEMARYRDNLSTLTKPVLANEEAYGKVQSFLVDNLAKFTGIGRITGITVKFPPFSEAKVGNTFTGTACWSAIYVDDLEGVAMSGSISF